MNDNKGWQKGRHWTILCLSMVGSACLAILAGQDAGFDLFNYHFYSGFALLHKPFGYDLAPAQIQSFHNPLIHVLSYWTLAHLSARWAAALLGAVQGLNFYFVFRIIQILFSESKLLYRYALGLMCAGAGYYGITSTTELGATYGDNIISIPVLAGLLLIAPHLKTGEISGKGIVTTFAIAGSLVGAAFGLKSTSAIYLLGFLLALPLVFVKSRGCGRVCFAAAGGSLIGFLATYGFWGTQLYLSYQNPVFPYLNKLFHSQYFSDSNFLDDRFLPRNWQQLILYPFFFVRKNTLVSEVEFRDVRLALCYTLLIILAGRWCLSNFRHRAPGVTGSSVPSSPPFSADGRVLAFLSIFYVISYVSWIRLSSIYRYLAVLELLAPIFLIVAVRYLVRREIGILVFAGAVLVITIGVALPIHFGRSEFADDLLKLKVPDIEDLDKCVILMSGYEPVSYIVPSFPATTRFVRVSSTFSAPGKIPWVDAKIERMLSGYDGVHRLLFLRNAQEIGLARLDTMAYGLNIDTRSCYEIESRDKRENRGFLCGMAGNPVRTTAKPVPDLLYRPKFGQAGVVGMTGRVVGKYFDGEIDGLKARFVDLFFEIDGEPMPILRRWALAEPNRIHLGQLSRNGNYRIVGIRDSDAPDPDTWFPVDFHFRVDLGSR